MRKWVFLFRPDPGCDHAELTRLTREVLPPRLAGLGADELVLHVTTAMPPRLDVLRYRRTPLAVVSLRARDAEVMAATRERLRELPGQLAGYRVDESTPIARARSWPIGTAAPGPTLLTLFRRHPSLSRHAFLREWYGHHTPLALEVHPLFGYVRNAVEDSVIPGSPAWDGIVAEEFRTPSDLRDPRRFFGGASQMVPNMVRVAKHASQFLDLGSVENYLASEVVLRT